MVRQFRPVFLLVLDIALIEEELEQAKAWVLRGSTLEGDSSISKHQVTESPACNIYVLDINILKIFPQTCWRSLQGLFAAVLGHDAAECTCRLHHLWSNARNQEK